MARFMFMCEDQVLDEPVSGHKIHFIWGKLCIFGIMLWGEASGARNSLSLSLSLSLPPMLTGNSGSCPITATLLFFFFIALGLELCDTKVYEP